MSVSMYQSQVDRLTKEISDLQARSASEQGKAVDAASKARRAQEAMGRTSSASTAQSKAREAERHARDAAKHDQAAAAHSRKASEKGRSLSSAQSNLARAVRQDRERDEREGKRRQAKDDAEAKRRRDAEMAHVRELERRRRAAQSIPDMGWAPTVRAPTGAGSEAVRTEELVRYDVCLSFAGEQRGYVALVADGLREAGLEVFYDEDAKVATWGADLTERFDAIYRQQSRFCVMFISAEYAAKEWTRLERRSALARAVDEEVEYILPVRFDDTPLPGLRPSVAYLDAKEIAPATLVEHIVAKVGARAADAG